MLPLPLLQSSVQKVHAYIVYMYRGGGGGGVQVSQPRFVSCKFLRYMRPPKTVHRRLCMASGFSVRLARDTLLAAVLRYCEQACVRACARAYYIPRQACGALYSRRCETVPVRCAVRALLCSHELSQLFRALNTRTLAARADAITDCR